MMKAHICLTAVALIAGSVALAEDRPAEYGDLGRYPPVQSIPEGYMIIEGDIVVPEDFFDTKNARGTYDTDLWPGGIVPFVFDANVDATHRWNEANLSMVTPSCCPFGVKRCNRRAKRQPVQYTLCDQAHRLRVTHKRHGRVNLSHSAKYGKREPKRARSLSR